MSTVVSVNNRGTLTLPKEYRMQLGLLAAGRIVAQETKRGILLRAEDESAVKPYSKVKVKVARIAKAEAALAPLADDLRASLARARNRRR